MVTNLKTRCTHCHAAVKVTDQTVGKRVRCPACRRVFEVATIAVALGEESTSLPVADETIAAQAADTSDALPASAAQAARLGQFGRFELKELLGQGAFGRVYRAYDPQLDRSVALKVPTFGPEDTHKVNRFITEAKSAARLRHPNIVPTYESGQIAGRSYIAAQFVQGQPLSRVLKDAPPDFRQAAEWVRQLADALAYAHSEGIVHRDIKPSNIMIDKKGIPQIMDFGLAKRLNEDAAMTTDGSILGTPAYMAPEQARGELASVGPASDQYSLGVVLYELLTGQKPFDGAPHAVIGMVIREEPRPVRSINRSVPRELEAICAAAMEKSPAQRYATTAELAADLARWLGGFETQACPITLAERALRWCRKNPVIFGLSTAMAAVLLVGTAISTYFAITATTQMSLVEQERNRANAEAGAARKHAHDAEMQRQRAEGATQKATQSAIVAEEKTAEAVAKTKLAEEAEKRATDNAEQAKAALEKSERVTAEVSFERALDLCERNRVAEGLLRLAACLALVEGKFPDLEDRVRTALASWRGDLHKLLRVVPHPSPVKNVVLTPDGRHLVTLSDDGQVRRWNVRTGEPEPLEFQPRDVEPRYDRLAMSPTQPLLAVAGESGHVFLQNADSGQSATVVMGQSQKVLDMAFSPDGTQLAITSPDKTIRIWFVRNGYLKATLPDKTVSRAVAWGPNGTLISGGEDRIARVWDVAERKVLRSTREINAGFILGISVSPRGDCFVTNHDWGQSVIWQYDSCHVLSLRKHSSWGFKGTAWHPTMHWLFSPGTHAPQLSDFYDPHAGRTVGSLLSSAGSVVAVACDQRGEIWATGGRADNQQKLGEVRLWQFSQTASSLILRHDGRVWALGAAPLGDELVTGTENGIVRVISLSNPEVAREWHDHGERLMRIAVSPDGQSFAAATASGKVHIHRLTTPGGIRKTLSLPRAGEIWALQYSPDGRLLVAGGVQRQLGVWRVSDLADLGPRDLPHQLNAVSFDSNDSLFAAYEGYPIQHWTSLTARAQGDSFSAEPGQGVVKTVEISPEGGSLVTGSWDSYVRRWNLSTSEITHEFAHSGPVWTSCFRSDGTRLVVGGFGGARVLDAINLQPLGPPLRHNDDVLRAVYIGDGSRVATSTFDGEAHVWDIPKPLEGRYEEIRDALHGETGLRLSASGHVVLIPSDQLSASPSIDAGVATTRIILLSRLP
jgi:WD40 repeat protein